MNSEKDDLKHLSRCLVPSRYRIQDGAVVRAEHYYGLGAMHGSRHLEMIRHYLRSSQCVR